MVIQRHLQSFVSFAAILLFAALGSAADAVNDEASSRARLEGAWEVQETAGRDTGVWTFEHKEGDVMHITYTLGNQKVIEFECTTKGKECEIKDSGKSAKSSMWFSGSQLVELETKGGEVVKRLFAVAPAGDSLEVAVIPIQPDGKTETLHFRRVQR
jgi:hypothetical protein